MPIAQLDNYSTWIRVGMFLQKLGALVSLSEEVSKRINKYKHGDCSKRWNSLNPSLLDR